MKHFITLLLCCSTIYLFAQSGASDKEAIAEVLMEQQKHWNAGNLEAFMNGYWKSDSLVFTSRNGLTRGWKTVMENYRRNYPSVQEMGHLSFSILHLQVFANQTALLVGQWQLQRAGGDVGGFFTLVWRKINGKWVIIADHTS